MKAINENSIRPVIILCAILPLIVACPNIGENRNHNNDYDNDSDDSNGTSSDNSECTPAQLVYKPVDFRNTWTTNVTIRVYEYDLDCPHVFQDPSDIAFGLGSPGYDLDAHLLLPQGSYSICIDWWEEDEWEEAGTYNYKFYGSLPDDPFFTLYENSDETVPLLKTVEAGSPVDGTGQCPDPVDVNGGSSNTDGDGDGDGDIGSSSGFPISYSGEYNYYIEMVVTEPEYYKSVVCDYTGPADIVANANGTLTVKFGEEERDSLCALPLAEPSGTHSNGSFTIPMGDITITGTLNDSSLSGSGTNSVEQGVANTTTTISIDLDRQ